MLHTSTLLRWTNFWQCHAHNNCSRHTHTHKTHQILSKIFEATHKNFRTTSSQSYELYRVVLVYTVVYGIELGLMMGGGVHLQQLTDSHRCISGWRKRELQFQSLQLAICVKEKF